MCWKLSPRIPNGTFNGQIVADLNFHRSFQCNETQCPFNGPVISGLYWLTSQIKVIEGVSVLGWTSMCDTFRMYWEKSRGNTFLFSLICLYFQDLWCLYCKFICYQYFFVKKKKKKSDIGCKSRWTAGPTLIVEGNVLKDTSFPYFLPK